MSDQQIPAVWQRFADVCGTTAHEARSILAQSIMPKGNDAERLAFIAVCGQYNLNPLRKEVFAFPTKGGGIQPIVSVDGWLAIANRNSEHEAIETEEIREGGQLVAVTARVWKKGLQRATTATEYLSECRRNTDPWNNWPTRMLTNKAIIQAIRRAYAVSGIMEPDEAERIQSQERMVVKTLDTRDTLLQAARGAASEPPPSPDPEPEYQPTDEDMAAWTESIVRDPEAAQ